MTIIALGHRSGVGKDSLAAALGDHGFRRIAFADALKSLVERIAPHLANEVWEPVTRLGVDEAEWRSPAVRTCLVDLAQAVRAEVGDDVWVQVVVDRLHDEPEQDWVVSDVRFPVEVEALGRLGAVFVRVDRPGAPLRNDGADDALDGWDGWDAVVRNDGSLADLADQAPWLVGFAHGCAAGRRRGAA